jgi:hypothetical protein
MAYVVVPRKIKVYSGAKGTNVLFFRNTTGTRIVIIIKPSIKKIPSITKRNCCFINPVELLNFLTNMYIEPTLEKSEKIMKGISPGPGIGLGEPLSISIPVNANGETLINMVMMVAIKSIFRDFLLICRLLWGIVWANKSKSIPIGTAKKMLSLIHNKLDSRNCGSNEMYATTSQAMVTKLSKQNIILVELFELFLKTKIANVPLIETADNKMIRPISTF